MPDDIEVTFLSAHRKATQPPQIGFLSGVDIDAGFRQMCAVDLPYPAECCGTFLVKCKKCGMTVGFTAAGRGKGTGRHIACFILEPRP